MEAERCHCLISELRHLYLGEVPRLQPYPYHSSVLSLAAVAGYQFQVEEAAEHTRQSAAVLAAGLRVEEGVEDLEALLYLLSAHYLDAIQLLLLVLEAPPGSPAQCEG